MYKKLSEKEIIHTLEKIRKKYKEIIMKFNKPKIILDAFEDRYLRTLRHKMDISVFLLGEIDAIAELYQMEEEKLKKKALEKKQKHSHKKSFADKIYEENRKKILKYPKVTICIGADEELERLIGAIRDILNNYWPIINLIFKNEFNSTTKNIFNDYYHKLLAQYDYKDNVPITKSYIFSLQKIPRDNKKIDYEHHYILKETAFLLNDILDSILNTINNEFLSLHNEKIDILNINNDFITKNFSGLNFKQGLEKIMNYLQEIINDFRIKEIKRKKTY